MTLQIHLYGAFKDLPTGVLLEIAAEKEWKAKDLLLKLETVLPPSYQKLVQQSVLATEEGILQPNDLIGAGPLSLLPPVCGG